MNDDDKFTLIACGVVALCIGVAIWCMVAVAWQNESVELGHAEYYLDAQHNKQWRWKTNCVHDVWKEKP